MPTNIAYYFPMSLGIDRYFNLLIWCHLHGQLNWRIKTLIVDICNVSISTSEGYYHHLYRVIGNNINIFQGQITYPKVRKKVRITIDPVKFPQEVIDIRWRCFSHISLPRTVEKLAYVPKWIPLEVTFEIYLISKIRTRGVPLSL